MSIDVLNNYEYFKNAYNKLKEFINGDDGSEISRAGIVHAFEFTFELWWKFLQKYLEVTEIMEEHGPSAVIRIAAEYKILENGQEYMEMLRDRNLTSHTYKEDIAKEIYERIKGKHIRTLEKFIEKFDKK